MFFSAEVPMELYVDVDCDSNDSEDSFAVLPDLRVRPSEEDASGPKSRASRAQTASRRRRPVGTANKIPLGISHVDLVFQRSTMEANNKRSGEV